MAKDFNILMKLCDKLEAIMDEARQEFDGAVGEQVEIARAKWITATIAYGESVIALKEALS